MDAAEAGQGEVLVADVGNTETRLGLARDGELAATWATTTPEHLTADEAYLVLRGLLDLHAAESGGRPQPCGAIMASVVPDLTEPWGRALQRACGRRALVVGPGLKTGLKMRYNDPAEIGADRIADLVAARALYGAPCVVVDWGTTTNFEVIDRDGAFLGGAIAPGLRLSVASLSQAAARLSVVEVKAPPSVIGKNTREAVQSGAVLGEAARVDGMIDLVWAELGYETPVVASGGRRRRHGGAHEARRARGGGPRLARPLPAAPHEREAPRRALKARGTASFGRSPRAGAAWEGCRGRHGPGTPGGQRPAASPGR